MQQQWIAHPWCEWRVPLKSLIFAFALSSMSMVSAPLQAQTPAADARPGEYKPSEFQAGKDLPWVATPDYMVERMLDLARVSPQDFVVDLGSGDGRVVIATAKRGARALGVEYNPDLMALARRNAAQAGVADKASFVQGDMYATDVSQATVMALFLTPGSLLRLIPTLLTGLKPGTRIVSNTFDIPGWNPDEKLQLVSNCLAWCEAMIYYVPAQVAGAWQLGNARLVLNQRFQEIYGVLYEGEFDQQAVTNATLRGDRISFSIGPTQYDGRITSYKGRIFGVEMQGTRQNGSRWSASHL